MTTGRINQITSSSGPTPRGGRAHAPGRAEGTSPLLEGVHEAPGRCGTPGAPGGHRRPSICPHCSSSGTGPHAGPRWNALRAAGGCGIRPSDGGTRPRGHAGERRLPQDGSPRESALEGWPATNDPQTPSVPGTQRLPGLGTPRLGLSRARGVRCLADTDRPSAGADYCGGWLKASRSGDEARRTVTPAAVGRRSPRYGRRCRGR